jgi:hypothetical protein
LANPVCNLYVDKYPDKLEHLADALRKGISPELSSEDCLTVNIVRPVGLLSNASLPVVSAMPYRSLESAYHSRASDVLDVSDFRDH